MDSHHKHRPTVDLAFCRIGVWEHGPISP